MNPFFFGDSAKRLYGVYHPPRSASPRDTGVVLCYPFGQEYMRAHRAFRQLTMLLSKAGFHVLRFDYFGTGDSAGDSEAGSLAQWTEDVATAVTELRDTAAVERISLVGLRIGAAFAATTATQRTDIADLVLWDPIVRGTPYVGELLDADGPSANGHGPSPENPTGTVGVLGFPLTMSMRDELKQLDLTTLPAPKCKRAFLVVSHENVEFTSLRAHLQTTVTDFSYEHFASPGNWNEVDNFGSVLLPQRIIQGIVQCLT